MYLLNLSKEHPDLPLWEAWSLLDFDFATLADNCLFLKNADLNLVKRLAYTKSAFKVLFSCEFANVEEKTKKFDFNTVITKKYKVFYEGFVSNSAGDSLHDIIWRSLKNPKVDIKNPEQEIYFIKTGNYVHCCLKLIDNIYDYDERLPHKRIGLKPISLKPRLARCLVNLTGCKKGTIVDPFAGTSGILIEGMLCGIKVVGYDISQEMIDISKQNLDKLNPQAPGKYKLARKDFFEIYDKIDFIVTDLPYGKNTKNLSKGFFVDVAKKLDRIIAKRGVVVFPDYVNVNRIFSKAKKIRLVKTFDYYIHQSMSKKICILETF